MIALFFFANAAVAIASGVIYLFWFLLYGATYDYQVPIRAAVVIPLATPVIAMIVAGLVLWFRAEQIAGLLVDDSGKRLLVGRVSAEEWLPIVLAIVGVSLFIENVSGLARVIAIFVLADESAAEAVRSPDFWSGLVAILLSAWLVLGSRGLAGAIKRLRSGDLSPNESLIHLEDPAACSLRSQTANETA